METISTPRSAPERTAGVFDMEESSAPGQYSEAAKLYRLDLDDFNRAHVERESEIADRDGNPQRRMRIAVLDSGVSSTDTFIKTLFKTGRIVEGRNFTSQRFDDYEDEVGHGTLVTTLLAQAAPEAEIFVAKVARSHTLKFSDLGFIARAIEFAINFYDVDIITISMGIYEYHPDIEARLQSAATPKTGRKKRIVFVAAGGNFGGLDQPSWLAKIDGVIPIHAVDGDGDPHGRAPGANGPQKSFGVLGFDINLPKQNEQGMGRVYVTGTSYAIPFAAAIAAGTMEFVHRKTINFTSERRDHYERSLHRPSFIRAVFKLFSIEKNGHLFLQPWRSCQHIYWADTQEYSWLQKNNHRNLFKVLESILLDL